MLSINHELFEFYFHRLIVSIVFILEIYVDNSRMHMFVASVILITTTYRNIL